MSKENWEDQKKIQQDERTIFHDNKDEEIQTTFGSIEGSIFPTTVTPCNASDISKESLDSISNDSTLVDIYDEIEKCFCNFDVDVNSKMFFDVPFGITLEAKPCGKEKLSEKDTTGILEDIQERLLDMEANEQINDFDESCWDHLEYVNFMQKESSVTEIVHGEFEDDLSKVDD